MLPGAFSETETVHRYMTWIQLFVLLKFWWGKRTWREKWRGRLKNTEEADRERVEKDGTRLLEREKKEALTDRDGVRAWERESVRVASLSRAVWIRPNVKWLSTVFLTQPDQIAIPLSHCLSFLPRTMSPVFIRFHSHLYVLFEVARSLLLSNCVFDCWPTSASVLSFMCVCVCVSVYVCVEHSDVPEIIWKWIEIVPWYLPGYQ